MEGLRLDHMGYLQTMLAKTSGVIADYEDRSEISAEAKKHLRTLRENQEHLRKLISNHG